MKILRTILLQLACTIVFVYSFAQTENEPARELILQAIELMDEGQTEAALELLEQARLIEPDNLFIPYEMALAHYIAEDYATAIEILEELSREEDAWDQVFQMLGNSYSMNGMRDQAIEAYENGMERFPYSGILFLERGNVELFVEEYGLALSFYEAGIEADPTFSSNYYWAAQIFAMTDEEVWAMLYGELFMNIERSTHRTANISQLLYDLYTSEIQINSDNSFSLSFSKMSEIDFGDFSDTAEIRLPFGMGVYEVVLGIAVAANLAKDTAINISSLHHIRSSFIDLYFEKGFDKSYPNILFDYHKLLISSGHFEAYNYWLLMMGEEDTFEDWIETNLDRWNAFVDWFNENPLWIDDEDFFHRMHY